MPTFGRGVVENHGNSLPTSASLDEARSALMTQKDTALDRLLNDHGTALNLDFSFESLKRLERWFIPLISPEKTKTSSFPQAIAYYFGQVMCASAGFEWTVQEFAFQTDRYEIGVQKGLASIMLSRGWDFPVGRNARMDSLIRAAKKYAI
jgi:hypothetical protein